MEASIDAQRREIAAMRRVARMVAPKPTTYSVRALCLMTPGYGAMIGSLRHG
jgi:hypothetical protein